jgi:ABC-type dipeptide/oligopeptide/nickel transport system permease component
MENGFPGTCPWVHGLMPVRLTEALLDSLTPADRDQFLFDSLLATFGYRLPPKAIKESVGTDIFAALPSTAVLFIAALAVGLLLGSIVNLVLSLPWLGIVRALDDLITIAVARRGTPKLE